MDAPKQLEMVSTEEVSPDDVGELEKGSLSPMSVCLGVTFFPFTILCSWFTVQEQEEVVILNYGKYNDTVTSPGIHFKNCFGRDMRRVSKQKVSVDLPNTRVVDRNGNPLLISGILVYHFVNSKRAAIDMQNAHSFVVNQAQAVMKQVVSQYPYENLGDEEHGACLKTEAAEVGNKFVKILQGKVGMAGAKVLSFQFNEMSYAPEIAQGMLKRQQAMATVAARKTIVDGVVDIAHGAIEKLELRGIKMSDSEKTKIATNLLTVMCGEQEVQPTISVGNL
eukprot:TRINITY_DN6160_c0_g1_i1.p1 TRINITY_DN6160_c0_g1~~TRINITY_DN6160_c0_g1_i1.p1  ORF type:complete len:279 (-),score=49.00 TRINITY_DN6160_c0_g1_i1:71-907(-)